MNIAEFSVNAMRTGILRDTHFLDKYQNDPDVLYARPIVQPGSKVSWPGALLVGFLFPLSCNRATWQHVNPRFQKLLYVTCSGIRDIG